MKNLILGIDPGFTGAIAFLDIKTQKLVCVKDIPLLPKNKKIKKRQLDTYALASLIDIYAKKTKFAVVEEVGAMPGQGVVSMFRFGYVTGVIIGAVSSSLIPYFSVKPAVWKPLLGLTRDKNLSRKKATELFPDHASVFTRVQDDGRAEAALLAWMGLTKLNG